MRKERMKPGNEEKPGGTKRKEASQAAGAAGRRGLALGERRVETGLLPERVGEGQAALAGAGQVVVDEDQLPLAFFHITRSHHSITKTQNNESTHEGHCRW